MTPPSAPRPRARRRWRVSPIIVAALALGACRDVACTPQYDTPSETSVSPGAAAPRPGTDAAFDDSTALSSGAGGAMPSPDSLPLGSRVRAVPPAAPPAAPVMTPARRDSLVDAAPRVAVPASVRLTRSPGSALVVPVAGLAPSDIADTFDDARSEGRVHDAADLMAPRGTPVVAAAAGTVARLFVSVRGGLTVYVLSDVPAPLPDSVAAAPGQQTVHYYAHLDAFAAGLTAGQRVTAGQVLGTAGETGNVSPGSPHLHFAVWVSPSAARFWDGANVNPAPLLWGQPTRPARAR